MLIRPATRADGPAVKELVFSILAEYGLCGDPGGTDADIEDIEASYLQRGGWFVVVEEEGEPAAGGLIGSAGLYPSLQHAGVVELRKMYLKKNARGRGLGKELMRRALEFARTAGFKAMELETSGKLTEAIGLYEKAGFTEVPGAETCGRCDRVMRLAL